ncbi:hypothetical protein HOLleu_23744 [Holothuria leucospilota]|uniref:Uncharacterized protein n=1 Tax=Holothuria leucospilota TaxID=206669 RepID=A0A9Q1BVQ2_HOLLE|nr:hypothetical protein HOLleu_23744 [Holothuria leucospilota]
MARRTITKLRTAQKLLEPIVVAPQNIQEDIEKRQNKARHYFDQKTKHLKPLQQQDTIRERPNQPRSYNHETEQGTIWKRNRRDILKTKERNIFQRKPPDDGLEGCPEAVSSNPKHHKGCPSLNLQFISTKLISVTDP